MKRFRSILRHIVLVFFLLLTHQIQAQTDSAALARMDAVDISLLSCQPRQYIYSLYGHTAIRITDHSTGTDYAVNYGLFSFEKPFFVLRFVFGLTDYEMGICSYEHFKIEYERAQCGVVQQVLDLSREDKLTILQAIDRNAQPENVVYRYNFFYDNCTTRARDIIINNVEEAVTFPSSTRAITYRQMVHQYTAQHPWARFGNDLLLGVGADRPTDARQQQFLPFNLKSDFDHTTLKGKDGAVRPLVKEKFWAISGSTAKPEPMLITPIWCAIALAIIILTTCLYDAKRKRVSWALDGILWLLTGLAGLILFAMVFSQHPTVRVNFQILMLNPLALGFLYPTLKALRHKKRSLWLTIWPICLVLFFIGAFWQTYADGMCILASSLLVRAIFINYIVRKEQ